MSETARPVRVWSADLSLLAVTAVWGVTFPVVKGALADAGPLSFNALRLSVAALLLALVYRPKYRRLSRAAWAVGALLGGCLALGYGLQNAGLALTSPSVSAFLTGMSVILVPLLLAFVWRRRLPYAAWFGTGLALLGLYWLVGTPGSVPAMVWRGDTLTLGCALAFAFHIVILGEWAPRLPFRDLAVLMVGFAAGFTWLLLPALERPHWHVSLRLVTALAITAVLATAAAFTIQAWAQQFTPATHTAVIFALEPVFAWLASAIGWHERLRAPQILGASLIVAAMLVVEWGRVPNTLAASG